MKNILVITLVVILSTSLFSCKKNDAKKDIDTGIVKLKQFNNKFNELYTDGQISRDTLEGKESSEYDELKQISAEYYEVVNKINGAIEKETKKKKDKYTKKYKELLEEKKGEIDDVTSKFNENLTKI